ncbi:hypothetical protein ACVGW7_00100, partial [Enterobacter intestinihominis]
PPPPPPDFFQHDHAKRDGVSFMVGWFIFIRDSNRFVVPGGKMGVEMELIMTPLVQGLMEGKKIA